MQAGWDEGPVEPHVYHKAGSLNDDDAKCVCAWRRFHGGVEDRCVSGRESDVEAQGGHQSAGDGWTWTGHRGQDREANLVLQSNWFHVESKSQTRARSDHVGWIGIVDSSSTDAGYSCNDKDNAKSVRRVFLGSC